MKLKTQKTVAKRYRITKSGKIMRKTSGQDHFNARESGNVTRAKRSDAPAHQTDLKSIKQYIPYR
ncbi:50S ribosomal protein L35 [Candidatus Uhrbacteria bacterium]|nr:50S ribosomal protein L35 [Candidatus Uhrbacteria bacterium]